MVTTQLNQFWKIAVNKDLSRAINPTLIRKITTTTVHEKEPSIKREVATMMNDDIRPAEKNYFLEEKKKVCLKLEHLYAVLSEMVAKTTKWMKVTY